MKKVLVLASTFPRWKNDTTPRFVYELSDRLASKYQMTVLVPHHKGALKSEKLGKVDVRRFAYFKPEYLQKLCYGGGIIPNMKSSFLAKMQMPALIMSEYCASVKLLKNQHFDLLHAHWMLPQGLVGVFLKKKFKIPLLVTIHGSDLFPLKNKMFKKLQNFVLKNADYITVNSISTKNELISRFPSYAKKVSVIPMGVDTSIFKKSNVKKPKKYEKNKIILFVGRLSDQKGLQYLIEALPEIAKYEPKIKLLMIGEGPYEKTLKDLVQKNSIKENTEFLGSLPVSEVSKYYNYADIFVLPSLSNKTGTEALGLTILEAMSSGCAVIGTDVGGISYVIKNNSNGILVEQKNSSALAKSTISLLKDKNKSKELGKNAAKFARKNYSWENVSKEFIKTYSKLIKN